MKEKIRNLFDEMKVRSRYKSMSDIINMIEPIVNQEVEKRIAERMPSGPKRLFQILDEMNLDDTKYGTRLVSISNSLISADKVKAGTKVAMGADDQVLIDIMSDKCALLLVVIDRKEYEKRKGN